MHTIPALDVLPLTSYVFRGWLPSNPLLEFEPINEGWRDIEVDGSHTLAEFHEVIQTIKTTPRMRPGIDWPV